MNKKVVDNTGKYIITVITKVWCSANNSCCYHSKRIYCNGVRFDIEILVGYPTDAETFETLKENDIEFNQKDDFVLTEDKITVDRIYDLYF